MRSRSHRLPTAEPRHDDWVDGSWTVDCVCGVTFDDGEEMVNCDECGVWVHTRCSRYVKSEKSFACDKCKSKSKSGGGIIGNESEETEVAEFLVELPNKAMGTDNPNPATVASRRPFRLWAETPMEERVHVQGIPGGEPSLFSGINMSSIFGSQLWKSTGYVPKKFSLRYSEFPFSGQGKEEEEDMDKTNGEKSSARADNGARVLVSLLNKSESSLPTPVVDSAAVKGLVEGRVCGEIAAPRQKKLDSEKSHSVPEDSMKKKRNSVTVVLNPGKRKKEEHRALKDQNVKKKVRVVEKEGDVRKRATHEPKASASTFSRDAKLLESSQDRGCKGVNSDLQCGKNPSDHLPDRLGECATNLASNEHGIESTPKNDISNGEALRVETKGAHVPVECENLSNTCNGMESLAEVNCLQSLPVKEEVTGDTLQRCVAGTGSLGIGSCEKEPAAAGVKLAAGDAKESGHGQESDLDEANSRPVKKLRTDLDADDNKDHVVESVHLNEVKLDGPKASIQPILSVKVVSGEGEVVGTSNMKAEASEAKLLDANRSLVVCRPRTDKPDESNANAHLSKREHSASEGSLGAKKRSSGLKPSSEAADELLKSNGTARSHSSASYQRKAGVTVLRSNSTSGIMSKSSENCTGAAAQNSSIHVRQELSDSSQGTMKDNASADKVDRVEKSGRTKKLVKESLRSGALSKVSETNKLTNTTDSKKIPSDSKDPSVHSSSKVPLGSKVASTNVSGESASPPPTEGGSSMQSKGAASAIPGKGKKPHQSGCNPSSRGHVAAMTSPASSNVPATLSDEELALLLHQELNSSPRVPRVPRMRHAGSLPQLTGPSATSVLMKRTSNGVKDHGMVSRRRTKDSSGEGLHAYPKNDSEAKKMERKPNSPDNRRQDSSYSIDQQSRKEADGGMVKSSQSMKKTNTNSSLSSSTVANGHHMSSSHLSSRNASNDDTRIAGRQTNRTLPGLIAEIMSEGKRMTYEELCNAVLPHWPHLRKHNGERYAYSSHSQAVLDCLRNRSEWARLVDRGPKTNASRKRHKHDADSMSVESEDNEDHTIKNSKEDGSKSFDSHQEEFPKGKRKARKRRRLALQGRGIVRRRRRADVVSDDESESFSYSSEESASSEEEIQGAGTSAVGSEVSGSSDEAE